MLANSPKLLWIYDFYHNGYDPNSLPYLIYLDPRNPVMVNPVDCWPDFSAVQKPPTFVTTRDLRKIGFHFTMVSNEWCQKSGSESLIIHLHFRKHCPVTFAAHFCHFRSTYFCINHFRDAKSRRYASVSKLGMHKSLSQSLSRHSLIRSLFKLGLNTELWRR